MRNLIRFPTNMTRATCYACFDFPHGEDNNCPICRRSIGKRLPEAERPKRPPMFHSGYKP